MEKELIPQLRFSDFNDEWKIKKIENILTIGSGKDYKHLKDGEVPVYGTGGYMTSVNEFLYEGESVCIGRKGTIDNPIFLNEKFWTVDTLFYTHSFKQVLPRFVYSLFQNINWYKHNEASGVPSLSKKTIEKININIPSLPEQQKIASFLSDVDDKITKLTKKKDLLEQYKKGIMQKIFNQELRFKDDNGNEFPKWQEKKLGEVCKLQGGYAFKSNQFKKQGIPIIRISNISNNNNFIDSNNLVYYDDFDINENFILKKDDLIVAMSGATTGKSSIYNLEVKGFVNQRVGVFRPQNNLLNKFLIQFVFSNEFIKQLDKVLVAGAQPNISSKDIETFIIPIPCLKEQTKIANFLSDIDIKIEALHTKIENSKTFKKGLLQQMFV